MTTYETQRWTLDDLLARPGTPEVEKLFADVETRLAEMEAFRDKLAPDMWTKPSSRPSSRSTNNSTPTPHG